MNIFISGISGTGMGPLALMAKQAGHTVWGTDLARGAIYDELIDAGIDVHIGPQDGEFLKEKIAEAARGRTASEIAENAPAVSASEITENTKITDERTASEIAGGIWYVHTSALPADNPELQLAKESGLKVTKRDELTAYLVKELNLKMVAVAGTHGKTTTTSMITYASLRLHLPVSYIVGTTLGFAPSGAFHQGDKFFIYEADEYDRNFLKFHPWLSVITCATYDHPDIYPTRADYEQAFAQFRAQSESVIDTSALTDTDFHLAGEVRRRDAALARAAIIRMLGGEERKEEITAALNDFPGVGRRFERIADGVYTDYAHHPEEISATIDIAREEAELRGKKGVVVVYQPHQNTRQHEVREGYKDAFTGAEHIYWLPTYLTRENPALAVLTPADLISGLSNSDHAEPADLDDALAAKLKKYVAEGYLVLLMTAGPADTWLRSEFSS